MPKSQRFFLPRIAEVHHIADGAHHFDLLGLSLALQKSLQLGRIVEMIFDGVLASPCNDNDVLDPRGHAFLDDILNQRLIDDGKHLFGLRFGGRQKSGAQTSGWKDGFAHASALICHSAIPEAIPV